LKRVERGGVERRLKGKKKATEAPGDTHSGSQLMSRDEGECTGKYGERMVEGTSPKAKRVKEDRGL